MRRSHYNTESCPMCCEYRFQIFSIIRRCLGCNRGDPLQRSPSDNTHRRHSCWILSFCFPFSIMIYNLYSKMKQLPRPQSWKMGKISIFWKIYWYPLHPLLLFYWRWRGWNRLSLYTGKFLPMKIMTLQKKKNCEQILIT